MTAAAFTERGEIDQRLRGIRATKARRSLAEFVRQAVEAGVVDGLRSVQWGPHLDALCTSIQLQLEGWLVAYGFGTTAMIARQRAAWERTGATWEDGEPEPWLRYPLVQNAIWNVPPTTLKSTIAMVLANAWVWLLCPTFAFGAASGIDSNVDRDSKATRDLVRSDWYRSTFEIAWDIYALPTPPAALLEDAANGKDGAESVLADWYQQHGAEHMRPAEAQAEARRLLESDVAFGVKRDTDAVSDWATTAGGKRRSRTINAGFTGTHVDGQFIDDPDDADRVWSEADRVRPQNRFTRAIETRVNCEIRTIRLVLQQRVHVQDFTAYLLSIARWSPESPKGWALLCIPARFGRAPADAPKETPYGVRDWRSLPDEMIHPRITAGVLADKIVKLGASGVAGQYDQNPDRERVGVLARRLARFFVVEGEDPTTLRRRPLGCPDREAQPPIVVRRSALTKRTLSVDANNTLDVKPGAKLSAVGLTVDAMIGTNTFVLDDRTRVLDVGGTYLAIFDVMAAWMLDEILVELKAAGPSVVTELRLAIRRGWYMHPVTDVKTLLLGPDGRPARPRIELANPREGKPARNQGLVRPWNDGTIFLHDGAPWLDAQVDAARKTIDEGFVGEVCGWPSSLRSDRLDSLSQYVARHRVVPTASGAVVAPIVLTREQ